MNIEMDKVFCAEVIISTQNRRGAGIDPDPIRVITQVFSKEGALIAEHDPYAAFYTTSEMLDFCQWWDMAGEGRKPDLGDLFTWKKQKVKQ